MFWAQRRPCQDPDTCERLRGFYFVLGTTWASWSRDTCESLSGFYLVLVTPWASPGGRKQFAFMGLCFGKSPEWQDPPPVLWVFMFPIRVFRVGVSVNMFYYILPTFFQDRFCSGSLVREATDSGPSNTKSCENCIRYVGFVPKSPVPSSPPTPR